MSALMMTSKLMWTKCLPFSLWKNFTFKRWYVTKATNHVVLVSQSDDIYMNLAFEDWLYEHEDLTSKSILLMWKNKPTVVIGRHQNAFLECDVWKLAYDKVSLARRRSGGGAVYHDEGNLNCSFIKDKSLYNRYNNLDLVLKAIKMNWDVDLSINAREDMLLDGFYKVSGTASKIGRAKAYHHFTLIFDVDKDNLFRYLNSPMSTTGVKSRATQSQKSQVKNLSESIPGVNFDSLVNTIGQQFLKEGIHQDKNLQWINPDDAYFPGLNKIYEEFSDWEWIYGTTPKFSLKRHFAKNMEFYIEHGITINIDIEKGRIAKLEITTNFNETFSKIKDILLQHLIGTRFWQQDLQHSFVNIKQDLISSTDKELTNWVVHCLSKTLFVT